MTPTKATLEAVVDSLKKSLGDITALGEEDARQLQAFAASIEPDVENILAVASVSADDTWRTSLDLFEDALKLKLLEHTEGILFAGRQAVLTTVFATIRGAVGIAVALA